MGGDRYIRIKNMVLLLVLFSVVSYYNIGPRASEGPDWLPKMKSAIRCTFLFTACPLMVTE